MLRYKSFLVDELSVSQKQISIMVKQHGILNQNGDKDRQGHQISAYLLALALVVIFALMQILTLKACSSLITTSYTLLMLMTLLSFMSFPKTFFLYILQQLKALPFTIQSLIFNRKSTSLTLQVTFLI